MSINFLFFFYFPQVVNSVVMNHVTIADGCTIQNSVICSNVQLQERVVLKDCQVSNQDLFLVLPFAFSYVVAGISKYVLYLRLVQILLLPLGVSAKGRRWPRKKNEYEDSLLREMPMTISQFVLCFNRLE